MLTAALLLTLAAAEPSTFDTLLDGVLTRTGMPGIAAAVVQDGKVIARSARGVREAGKPEPIRETDHFLAGSCTKSMTRLLLLRLAQAGKLDLGKTLAEALPDVPMQEAYRKATVRDVVRHTAGLQPYTEINPDRTPNLFVAKGETPEALRGSFARLLLTEPPAAERGKFVYSNAGYALLGLLAERAAGKPWEALLSEEVFGPLGMKDARLGRSEELGLLPDAVGHGRGPKGYWPNPRVPPVTGVLAPAGAVNLTLADFAAFAAAEAAAQAGRATPFLGAKAVAELASLRLPGAAEEGQVFLGSEGSFTAGYAVWPSRQVGIVVLSNGGFSGEVVEEAVEAARAAYAPSAAPAPARPPRPPPGAAPGPGPRLGVALRVEPDGVAVIEKVAPGSRGEEAGLREGDRITAVNGTPPGKLTGELGAALAKPAKLSIVREGKAIELALP